VLTTRHAHDNRCYKGKVAVVLALLKAGAKVSAATEGGGVTSALHQCAVHGHDDCLTALLDHPSSPAVDVNLLDKEGSTPLHKAAYFGHAECVKLLLRAGADVMLQDGEGSTPLHKAAFSGQATSAALLIQAGADVEAQDREDGTPLHNAAFNGTYRPSDTTCV
jgi:ankyrin repeat protein